MPNLREIRRRISSVNNIGQVTRALEAVSASRVRKAQTQAANSRVYAQKSWEVLVNVAAQFAGGVPLHTLLEVRPAVNNITILLITSDRGLAGPYNNNVIRKALDFSKAIGVPVRWVTVGRKGRDTLLRASMNVIAEYSDLPAELTIQTVGPIAQTVIGDFISGQSDQIFIAYTDFVNFLVQRPVVLNLLPLRPFHTENQAVMEFIKQEPTVTTQGREYLYEPSPLAVLDEVLPRFTQLQIYQAILESSASEHAARMVAMRNASENAQALAADLRLVYNKARQLAITSEILDIVGGVEALAAEEDAKPSKKRARLQPIADTAAR